MYRTHIILVFVLLFVMGTVLTSALKTRSATSLASVGWHYLASVGWVG